MPLTLVALSSRSALISIARRLAAVSVVKNGLPVPAARMQTRPFSRWRTARRRMYSSQTSLMRIADITRACSPSASTASCIASEFMTVASMPM